MRSIVRYSGYVKAVTAIVFVALFIGCVVTLHETPAFYVILALYLMLLVAGLLYGAAYVRADADSVVLGSILKKIRIPVDRIVSVERFQPTMGAIRVMGSGGFMGYWGIFREGDIGRYYAFYGRSSDCFLIRTSNGDKYVVGCENPDRMTDYIRSQMNR